MGEGAHNDSIRDQFTRQAIPFAKKMSRTDRLNTALLFSLTKVSSHDTVLDVACGPGLIACEFAKVAREVTGIDLTPAMIERARILQSEQGLTNVHWDLGDIYHLPYPDGTFSLVITRYSFHHLLNPGEALKEMFRVCANGGRVCVADMVTSNEASDAFNNVEKLRDPSHVRALTAREIQDMFLEIGLTNLNSDIYRLELELEEQLEASAPNPDDADKFRSALNGDVGRDAMGVSASIRDGKLYYSYPTLVIVGTKTSLSDS